MNSGKITYLLLLALLFASCNKKEEEKPVEEEFPEFIVFGVFQQPSCGTSEQCVEIFKLESGSILEASNLDYPNTAGPYNGNFSIPHSNEDYLAIEAIFKGNIPDELLVRPSGMIGNPQPWTFQTFYFEYKSPSMHRFWLIDNSDGTLSPQLSTFISNIQNAAFIAVD